MKNIYSFIFLTTLIFIGCNNNNIPIKEVTQVPDQAIENFTVTETVSGKRHWVMEAPSAKIFEEQKKAILISPAIKFYKKGEYLSTLTAEKGSIDMNTYDITGEGKCFLNTAKGENLETTNLKYLSQAQKIVTDEKVKIVQKGNTVYGKGLEATPDLSTITIKNQTTEIW
ncbi:MAG: LPS export ABC transporter periplasmic protein LptC [Elusimicrobia bacterium]|nr:LPS export ABC transporter periplasmic protein LptC [Elusimicrobiota bacterium]